MLVEDFQTEYASYENFQILDIESMDGFFNASDVLPVAFEHLYGMPLAEFVEKRSEIPQTEMEIMRNILDHIGDRYFFIFTYHSDNHAMLVQFQEASIMNFGLDINDIHTDHVYICMMEKIGGATPEY